MPKPASTSVRAAEAGAGEEGESAGAVGDRMLGIWPHLAEGGGVPLGNEHRIIAETPGSARRPDEMAPNLALEEGRLAVGPGQAECSREIGPRPWRRAPGVARAQLIGHPPHGDR